MFAILASRRARGLGAILIVLAACTSESAETAGDAAPELLLTQSGDTKEADLRGFAARQQAFLRAMTVATAELGEFVGSGGFLFSDWTAPAPQTQRDLTGRRIPSPAYFTALSTRIAPLYATVESMELRYHDDQVVVLARHPNVQPSVTRWHREGDSWKVGMLTLNVPDEVVARLLGRGPLAGS